MKQYIALNIDDMDNIILLEDGYTRAIEKNGALYKIDQSTIESVFNSWYYSVDNEVEYLIDEYLLEKIEQ